MFVSRNTLIYVFMDISQCFTQYWSICFTEILNILFLIYLMMFPNILLDVFHEINRVIFHNIFHIVFQYFSLSRIQVASPSWHGFNLKFPAGNPSRSPVILRAVQARAQSHFQNSHKLLNYLFA